MLADRRTVGMVDIAGPLRGVAVMAAAQFGEEIELQMVVRVDQAGKPHVAGKIQRAGIHARTHRVSRTAGMAQAASKRSGRPARWNSSRSGSPMHGSATQARL